MKKSRIGALLFVLMLGCLLATSALGETFEMMGLEVGETARDWNESRFFERMEAITGVGFTFREYNDEAAYQAAKDDAFATGNLPDVLFKAWLSDEEELRYHESGQLVDLAPYLQEHAPTVYAILEARPEWREAITQPDGAITSLPILTGAERQCAIWIERVWLETLGLSMPNTIDEFTEVLRAFRDGDPNQNGKQDEVPLSIEGPWEAKFLLHAWGLTPNDYNIYVDDSGTVQFAPFAPEYREFCAWLNMAQTEGLISDSTFRMPVGTRASDLQTARSNDSSNVVQTFGAIVTLSPYVVVEDKTSEFSVLVPLEHDGARVYRKLLDGVGRGTFAITSACEDVPAVLSWIDYLYTEEGGRLAFAGVAGEDYTMQEDGTWKWNANDDYTILSDLLNNSTIANDTVTPGLEPAAFMRNSEITEDNYARRQLDSIQEYLVSPFPITWPTDEAAEARIAQLQAQLGTCVDTAIANFAMGKVELTDENWQAFQDELKALGAEEFTALWQAKYDAVKN